MFIFKFANYRQNLHEKVIWRFLRCWIICFDWKSTHSVFAKTFQPGRELVLMSFLPSIWFSQIEGRVWIVPMCARATSTVTSARHQQPRDENYVTSIAHSSLFEEAVRSFQNAENDAKLMQSEASLLNTTLLASLSFYWVRNNVMASYVFLITVFEMPFR